MQHRRTGNFLSRKLPTFFRKSRKEMRTILQQHRPSWHMKVTRYSFSGSTPSLSINYVAINKHLEKLRPHQGCNDLGVVIATKWLPRPLPILLQQWFPAREPYKIVHRSFFLQYGRLNVREVWAKPWHVKSVIEIFWNEIFIIRNTVRKGKSWCLVVICRKRSAFDLLFHVIVVLIFLKTCVKDRGDSSAWLLESKEGFD